VTSTGRAAADDVEPGLAFAPGQGSIVTVGTFDGVHLGHLHVLRRLAERGRETGMRSVLVTFHPHPLEVVNPAAAPLLLTVGDEKIEVLAEVGLDSVVVLPFTSTLQGYAPEAFVALLQRRVRLRELLIGHDHAFGRGRTGGVDMLRALGDRDGFGVDVLPAVNAGGSPVSSTKIRRAVAGGDLATAAAGLGRHYAASGRVVHGDKRGRLLGFPTLNLELPSTRKLLPPVGVYAVRAQTPLGTFGGMMNLGPRPTFGDEKLGLEVHLLESAGELYGARVRVEFIAWLRETRRFENAESLVAQLRRDGDAARAALAVAPARVDSPLRLG
jgi:riboflavin kinase/FMN adenylyltransferase